MSCEEIPKFSIHIDIYSSKGNKYEFVAENEEPVCPFVNPRKLKSDCGGTVRVAILLLH
jgi:hypothetical protein